KKENRQLFISRFKSNHMLMIGLIIFILAVLASIFAPWITPYTPLEMDTSKRLIEPGSEYWFGTDTFGRDIFSRIIYGIRASVIVGASVTIISGVVGLIVGLYASYYKILDHILMRICDGLLAFPPILLALALVAALGPHLRNVVIALSIVYFPSIARIVRSSAVVVREQTYVEAMKSLGSSSLRIIW